ncbi:hypothetical protein ACFOWU_11110 [Epilithonimonas zeae]|uniref:Circularly permuted type 2 ATP-grasp protein n=1 Tax=Epilithonimonas zeae TaxID=1416779 RepID=A0A1N6H8K8_9FLAO|nr:hypothetical protein [Epilithonimonas zeae]SIO16103.1 hypothetical protein SAMN05444409_2321 [Epilithonimonas zeae]
MIPKYRTQFNEEFSQEKHQKVNELIKQKCGHEAAFRLSESPIFLTKDFQQKLDDASQTIISQIKEMSDEELRKAIPANCNVPNDTQKPHFVAIDFGICQDENGNVIPQLIELQAFPSLFGFQKLFEEVITEVYPFLNELKNSLPKDEYIKKIKQVIVGNENPENVILLEIYPEKQKTAIDFVLTEQYLGIKTVCLTKIKKEGKKLFYENEGKLIQINRIYNRVIFDELDKIESLETEFNFREDVDVEWITHPNWFFKISKYILPKLKHDFVPKSYFLSGFTENEQLENFVLKPLFSFAGSGVNLNPSQKIISQIEDKENYILQRKVTYAPLFEDINGEFSKAEIRLLFAWNPEDENPELLVNLVRMTKAAMVNVDFNKKDAIWIGSSMAFFEK